MANHLVADLDRYREWGVYVPDVEALRLLPPEGVLARCIFGEARNCELPEKWLVGAVVRNRVHWWIPKRQIRPHSWAQIILQPKQFSWTNEGDPNLPKVLDPINAEPETIWYQCCVAARGIVGGTIPDATHGADHYHDKSIEPPYWAASMAFTRESEHFRFYRSARVPDPGS